MNYFVLSLLGALCWGIAPIFGKLGVRNIHPMDGLAARTVITLAFLLAWVIATNGWRRLIDIPSLEWSYLGIEAFFATLAGDLAYYAALKWGSAGVTAVILSASPVITVWASGVVLHERFVPMQLVGILLVTVGILLVIGAGSPS